MTSSRNTSGRSEPPAGAPAPSLRDLLRAIVRDRPLHARWLNTVSLLEQVGAQKIARSHGTPLRTAAFLKHLAEETRHAYDLKRWSHRVAPDECPTYESRYLLAGRPARRYLEGLDAQITHALGERDAARGRRATMAYFYVSLAVERRAETVYPLYQEVLDEASVAVSLKRMISEEVEHLAEMERALVALDPDWKGRAEAFGAVEEALFGEWMGALGRAVATWPGRPAGG